jgi:hypothetical protein
MTMKQPKPNFVRLASTPEDRAERVALGRRAGLHTPKRRKGSRAVQRAQAIRESRESAEIPA